MPDASGCWQYIQHSFDDYSLASDNLTGAPPPAGADRAWADALSGVQKAFPVLHQWYSECTMSAFAARLVPALGCAPPAGSQSVSGAVTDALRPSVVLLEQGIAELPA